MDFSVASDVLLTSFTAVQRQISLIPWKKIAANPVEYVKDGIPPNGHLHDPSYMHKIDAISLYLYWYGKQVQGLKPLEFVELKAGVGKGKRPVWKKSGESDEEEDNNTDGVEGEDKGEGKDNNSVSSKSGLGSGSMDSAIAVHDKGKAKEDVPAPSPGSPVTATNHLAYLKQLSKHIDFAYALKLLDYAVCLSVL